MVQYRSQDSYPTPSFNNVYYENDHSWPHYGNQASAWTASFDTSRNVDELGRRLTMSGDLFSIQRFVGGNDQSPFTADAFHSDMRKVESNGGLWSSALPQATEPDCYQRQGSPADTNISRNSHWTAAHSDYASDHSAGHPFTPDTDYSPTQDSVVSYDGFRVYAGCGGGVALSNIQGFDPDGTQSLSESLEPIQPNQDLGAYHHDFSHDDFHLNNLSYDVVPDVKHETAEDLGLATIETDDGAHESGSEYEPTRRGPPAASKRLKRCKIQSTHDAPRRGHKSQRINAKKFKVCKRGISEAWIRPFPCPFARYGCQSTFTSKNEWKRHVSTQHIKLGLWRCDMCPQPTSDPSSPSAPNDFNRKDLFTQHLRRMHADPDAGENHTAGKKDGAAAAADRDDIPEHVIAQHQERCYVELRTPPPRSLCLFCPKQFAGARSWRERMDHVGGHFEGGKKGDDGCASRRMCDVDSWREDGVLEDWLLDEGLVERDARGHWKLGDGVPLRARAAA